MSEAGQELLAKYASQRNAEAFRELTHLHKDMVYATCHRVLRHDADTEDAVQNCFLTLARKPEQVKGSVAGWLHRVALNAAIDLLRQAKARRGHEEKAMKHEAVLDEPTWEQVAPAVDQAINDLPEELRVPIIRYYLEGQKQDQIAQELDVTHSAVSKRLQRGAEELRLRLTKAGITLTAAALAALLLTNAAEAAPIALTAALGKMALASLGSSAPAGGTIAATAGSSTIIGGLSAVKIGIITLAATAVLTVATIAVQHGNSAPTPPQTAQAKQGQAAAPAEPEDASNKGTVFDEAGQPVAGAMVKVLRYGYPLDIRQTGTDGRFPLEREDVVAMGGAAFLAEVDGGTRQGLSELRMPSTGTRHEPVRIVVKPCRTITVSVRDAAGKAVPGAGVEVIASYRGLPAVQTDADGKAVKRIPQDAKVDWIIALKPGVGFDYFENYLSMSSERPAPPSEVSLVLDGAKRGTVKAMDTAGVPVAGVGFVPWLLEKPGKIAGANLSRSDLAVLQTDAKGMAVFDWLPDKMARGTPIASRSQEYSCPQVPILEPEMRDIKLTARLLRNVRIGGRVLLPDGLPAAGIKIQAEGRGNTDLSCCVFAANGTDGTWSALVYPDQSYVIAVLDADWAAPSYTGVIIREGHPRQDIDFQLGKGTLIHGTVTVGKDHKPQSGQTVTLLQEGPDLPNDLQDHPHAEKPGLARGANTDAQGRYAFRVGPGNYELNPGKWEDRISLTVKEEADITRDFQSERPAWITLRGRVTFNGRPVAGADVRAVDGRMDSKARTDAQGNFASRAVPEIHIILAVSPDRTLSGAMAAQAEDTEVAIELHPAATIRGRIVDTDGHPLVDVIVGAQMQSFVPDEPMSLGLVLQLEARTDTDGRFIIAGVPTGTAWHIHPYLPEEKRVRRGLQDLRIEKPGVIEIGDLVVEPAPKLAGVVRRADQPDKPVANACVRGTNMQEGEGTARGVFEKTADEQGRFRIFNQTGSMLLYSRDKQGTLAGFKEIPAEEDHENVIMELVAAGTVTGSLVDVKGNPQRGIELHVVATVIGRQGRPLGAWRFARETSADDGRFSISGLVPDVHYEVWLFETGHGKRYNTLWITDVKAEAIDLGKIVLQGY